MRQHYGKFIGTHPGIRAIQTEFDHTRRIARSVPREEEDRSMKSFVFATVTIAGLVGASAAFAADPITDRQTILKGFGDATRPVVAMLKGEAPFDAAKAKTALAAYSDGSAKLPALFPDNSRTGKTEASPRIWAEKARFEGLFAKLGKEADAASAAITDEASLKANFPKVLGNCKACHDDFREKK
jgi:cytochrome c556